MFEFCSPHKLLLLLSLFHLVNNFTENNKSCFIFYCWFLLALLLCMFWNNIIISGFLYIKRITICLLALSFGEPEHDTAATTSILKPLEYIYFYIYWHTRVLCISWMLHRFMIKVFCMFRLYFAEQKIIPDK